MTLTLQLQGYAEQTLQLLAAQRGLEASSLATQMLQEVLLQQPPVGSHYDAGEAEVESEDEAAWRGWQHHQIEQIFQRNEW